MKVSWLLKSSTKSTLLTILMTVLISACSSENSAAAAHSNANENGITNSSKNNDTNTNQPASISGTDTGSVTEDLDENGDGLLGASGKLNITDNDANEAAFNARTTNSSYGSITIDSVGNWNYGADNSLDVIQNLNNNEKLTDNLTISSIDGTTHTVAITINGIDETNSSGTSSGTDPAPVEEPATEETPTDTTEPVTNNPAIISGTDTGSVTEDVDPDNDTEIETEGQLTISDNDANEAMFIASVANTSFSDFTVNSKGFWRYDAYNNMDIIQNLNANETITDTYTVTSVDGTTHKVVITIHGADDSPAETNQAAIIGGADTGSVTEDVDPDNDTEIETEGQLTISDNDANEAAFIASAANTSFSDFTVDSTGFWRYDAYNNMDIIQNLNAGETITDIYTVTSVDGTTHDVVITIHGADDNQAETNQAAIIGGADTGSVTEDNDPDGNNQLETSGKLDITDADADEASFIAENHTGNFGSLSISTDGNWNYLADNDQTAIQNLTGGSSLTDSFTISSVDGTTHNIILTINGVDEATTSTADITLSWTAPSEREDNSAISLSEITGYKIYYDTVQGSYNNSVNINDGIAQSYTFTDLQAGTYYFVITTLDTEGRESKYSSEVTIIM